MSFHKIVTERLGAGPRQHNIMVTNGVKGISFEVREEPEGNLAGLHLSADQAMLLGIDLILSAENVRTEVHANSQFAYTPEMTNAVSLATQALNKWEQDK